MFVALRSAVLAAAGVLVSSLTILAIGVSAAFAADMPVKAVRPVPVVATWTGFYVGGEIGGAWGHEVGSTVFTTTFSAAGSQTPADISGFLGGLEVGYNYQLYPSWVVGVNADWLWTNTKGSTSRPGTIPGVVEFGSTNVAGTRRRPAGSATR